MNPLDYIQQKNPKIPLKVGRVIPSGAAFASTDSISLPAINGKSITTFFIPPHVVRSGTTKGKPLTTGDYLLATWKSPGTCGMDKVRQTETDNGEIRDFKVINLEQFYQESDLLRFNLRLVKAFEILSSQNIEAAHKVFEDIKRLFPEQLNSVVDLFSNAMRIQEHACNTRQQLSELEAAIEQRTRELRLETQSLTESRDKLLQRLNDDKARHDRLQSDLKAIHSTLGTYFPVATALLDQQLMPREAAQVKTPYREAVAARRPISFLEQAMTLTALISGLTGCLGLLHGSVGVGKTHSARQTARHLGASLDIIPIRPSWIEPADLLGYYDPLAALFRPGPFTEAVRKNGLPDTLHIVCLDELNLARIENYAADLLSRLEYSKQDNDAKTTLQLYSDADYSGLTKELEILSAIDNASPEQIRRRTLLENTLIRYPSRLILPPGLALIGTLNADETTFDLSPKVIDRAYCLHFPPTDLREFPPSVIPPSPFTETGGFCWSELQGDWQYNLRTKPMDHLWAPLYNLLSTCQFSQIGLTPGRRFQEDFRAVMALAMTLSIPEKDALTFFIWAKLLPRISYRPDVRRNQLLNRLLDRLDREYADSDNALRFTLQYLRDQTADTGVPMVRYFGVSG